MGRSPPLRTFHDLQPGWRLLFGLPSCSAASWRPAVLLCLLPSLSLSFGCEWLEVILHSDQHWRSFSSQLLKDGCMYRKITKRIPSWSREAGGTSQQMGTQAAFLWDPVRITLRAG